MLYISRTMFCCNSHYVKFVLPLATNLIKMPKHRRFLMRSHRLSLFKRHSSRTSHHSMMELLTYKRKLSRNITCRLLTINQSCSQRSDWPSNRPVVQHPHPVCKKVSRQCCFVILCFKQSKNKNPIISLKK